MRVPLLLFVMLLWAVKPMTAASDAEWADSVVRAAEECYQTRDMTGAVDGLYTLVRKAEAGAQIPVETVASGCLTLANIYVVYNDYISAVKYYQKGIATTRDQDKRMKMLHYLSVVYCILGDEVKARKMCDELYRSQPKNKGLKRLNFLLCNGFIEKAFGSRDKSAEYFEDAVSLVHDLKMGPKYYLTPLSELSEYYAIYGDKETALYWLKRYENAVQGTNNKLVLADARKLLMNMYISCGDRDKALEYSRLYVTTMDSLVNMPNFITSHRGWSGRPKRKTAC